MQPRDKFNTDLDEILEGIFQRSKPDYAVPPELWDKVDPRAIKTLTLHLTTDDLKWAINQIYDCLGQQEAREFMTKLKADTRGFVAKLEDEAHKALMRSSRMMSS